MSVRVALAKKQVYGKIRVDKGRTDLAKKKRRLCKIEENIFCACPMIEPGFPMLYVLVLFLVLSELR
jgi:hypothetical protein